MPGNPELSERELEILRLLATGASNKEIAQTLFISANTVKVHLRNIFSKIEVTSRTEAAMVAVKLGLVPGREQMNLAGRPVDDEAVKAGDSDQEEKPTKALPIAAAQPSTQRPGRVETLPIRWGLILALVLVLAAAGVVFFLRPPAAPADQSLPSPADSPRWQTLAPMPTPRMGLALAAYENRIYAIAGEIETGVTGIVERYDLAENAWIPGATKPTPVGDVAAAVIGGRIYLPGGRLASGRPTEVLEIYDPRLDAWSEGAPLPVALSAYALAAYEGKLYLFGGWDGQGYVDLVYEYDPSLDSWASKSAMPTGRGLAGAAVALGKIYVLGGTDGKGALRVNETYSPGMDDGSGQPWSRAEPLPEGRYAMGVASLADIIQVIGGIGRPGRPAAALEFFPQSNTWQKFGTLGPEAWTHPGVAAIGSHLYVLGGELAGEPTDQNLAYQAIYTIVIPVVR